MTAVWKSWTATSTASQVSVSFGAVAQLVFTTQPDGSPTGGVAFPQQPVLTAEDAGGNTVTNYAGTISLSITPSTPASGGPGALSGCTETLSSGVTSFSGCKINTTGTGYQLNASDGTWTTASAAFNVSAGPVTHLVFTTQPDGSPTGGAAFPQQPVVTAEDAGGNTVTGYTGRVSLSIKSGTGATGAGISGCTATLSSGVTSFVGCKIDKSGTGYQLNANDGTLTTTSNAFSVAVGPASQLLFTQQPDGSPTGGIAFPQQPVVTAEDAGGNTVTGYTGTISLSIKSGTGAAGAGLSGCTGTLTNGVTSFAGCKIDKAGPGYQLAAGDGALTTTSTAFNVTVGPLAQLVFTTQPDGSPTGGVAFPQQPIVTAEDAGGNTVNSYSGAVTLSIKSGTGATGATLSGCTGTLSSGVTSFVGCKIDRSATGYKLSASDGTFTNTSTAFNVTVGPATQLVFTTQPDGSPTATNAFPTQPVVTVEDAGGNTVTGYATSISLSIKSSTGTTGATLSGCTPSLVSGVDTFSGCSINDAGSGYQLNATSGSLPTATSSAFSVTSVTATSVAQATGSATATSVSTPSITPVSGSKYLIFVYCSGQTSACTSSSADATVSSPAFSSVTFDDSVGTAKASGKDCLQVFTATGSGVGGAVTVTAAAGQAIGFANVVQLSPGAVVQNGPNPFEGTVSPVTATLSSPNSNFGELVPVGVSDGSGATSISTPAGWSLLGSAQSSGSVGAVMSVFFEPTAQSSFSTTLSPTSPISGWATYSIEVGA